MHRFANAISCFLEKTRRLKSILNVSQAFDKMLYLGLLNKFKKPLTLSYNLFVIFYLNERCFALDFSNIFLILAGVPQGSVLSLTLYNRNSVYQLTQSNT